MKWIDEAKIKISFRSYQCFYQSHCWFFVRISL